MYSEKRPPGYWLIVAFLALSTVLMLIALAHQSVRNLRASRTTTAQAAREEA